MSNTEYSAADKKDLMNLIALWVNELETINAELSKIKQPTKLHLLKLKRIAKEIKEEL